MVAASGEKTGLRPVVAVGLFAAIIIALVITAFLGNKVDWKAQSLHKNSPDELAHRARDIVKRLGYTDQPTDSASGLNYNSDYLRYVEQHGQSVKFWRQVTKGQPAA